MMAQPCFLAVEKKERMSAKSMAPSTERKPLEIFWRNFIMRIALGLIVGEGHGRIVKKAQRVLFTRCQAQKEIVPGSARRTAARFSSSDHGSGQGRLGLVEGRAFGENGIVTSLSQCNQRRLQRRASFACEICRVTGTSQEPLHFARPLLFLDLDESL